MFVGDGACRRLGSGKRCVQLREWQMLRHNPELNVTGDHRKTSHRPNAYMTTLLLTLSNLLRSVTLDYSLSYSSSPSASSSSAAPLRFSARCRSSAAFFSAARRSRSSLEGLIQLPFPTPGWLMLALHNSALLALGWALMLRATRSRRLTLSSWQAFSPSCPRPSCLS